MSNIIYIGGYGRSGSTILDALLGNHPNLFGAGELAKFFSEVMQGGRCSCGRAYSECVFWRDVLKVLGKRLAIHDFNVLRQATRSVERFPQLPQIGSAKTRVIYSELWSGTIEAMREVSGKETVVDSSKTARLCWHRISLLSTLCRAEVKVIHIVRDPRAVSWSALRGSNRNLAKGESGPLMGGVYRAVFGWTLANLSIHKTHYKLPNLEVVRIRYEDMVRDPIRELTKLETLAGMDMEPILDIARGLRSANTGHGVGGNRLRRKGSFMIKEDDEWKRALPFKKRILVAALSWPLARKYGYNVFRRP
jgi:hypothetical protein